MWFSNRWDNSLQCNWMQRDMKEHEEIAKALKRARPSCGRTLRRSAANYTKHSLLIPKTKQLN
jgi:hypothetical protein